MDHDFSKRERQLAGICILLVFGCLALGLDIFVEGQAWNIKQMAFAFVAGVSVLLVSLVIGGRKTRDETRRLRKRLARLMQMFDLLPQAIVLFSKKKRLILANRAYSDLHDLDPSLLQTGLGEDELIALRRERGLPVLADCESMQVELDFNGKRTQSDVWLLDDGRLIQYEHISTASGGWIDQYRDVSAELNQRKRMADTSQFLDAVLQHVPSAIIVKDAKTFKYLFINNEVQKLNGWKAKDIIGRHAEDVFSREIASRIAARDQEVLELANASVLEREEFLPHSGGEQRIIHSKRMLIRDAEGDPSKLLTVIDDITSRREAEKETLYLATHDPLTGLKNRSWFAEKIDELGQVASEDKSSALVMIDLDGFKDVNDSFGHAVGDATLKMVANKIFEYFGDEVIAARLGGDEFSVFVQPVAATQDILGPLESLITEISKTVAIQGCRIAISASAGVTFSSGDDLAQDELFRQADIALYDAKSLGKSTFSVYTAELGSKNLKAKLLEMRLAEAIEEGDVRLHFQPIVDAQTGAIVSMEALARWYSRDAGILSPNEFVPIAEKSGLIIPLGERVLKLACEAAIQWPDSVRVSVNVSPAQFADCDLGEKFLKILNESGLSPTRLEVEITEATMLSSESESLRTLNMLREAGARIVIDDFGAGYSSINYIRSFPFDKIKIDKSYVDEFAQSGSKSKVILNAVIAMARELNLVTTAEGVETAEQYQQLCEIGCNELQGYYFSKPLPQDEALRVVSGGDCSRAQA